MNQTKKVFVLIENPYKIGNPYVSTLMDGVSKISDDIEWGYGMSTFWGDSIFGYDIIHVHWPDMILAGNSKENIEKRLEERIKEIKKNRVRIVVTCHNLEPHYTNDKQVFAVYNLFYHNADAFIHLANKSASILQEQYPQAKHVVIPHHTYDTLYTRKDRKECLRYLNLDDTNKYILCFGAFRDDEERRIVDSVLKHIKSGGVRILAPNYYKIEKRRNLLLVMKQWIKVKLKVITTPGLYIKGKYVSDEELPYYYGAASISLLQRNRILNSGNLPMGFLMGNVVVGPNVGNVGEILQQTGNPTFTVNDEKSLFEAVDKALQLSEKGKGEDNAMYAEENYSTSVVSRRLLNFYRNI